MDHETFARILDDAGRQGLSRRSFLRLGAEIGRAHV
mgnify:CR=1 FL=1